ncbi:MAG TPA: hypothetical protein VFP91_21415 [Vicinamibacterales bacterium]|nr:hypothetical protein [Vicinamibacterales bacterium]
MLVAFLLVVGAMSAGAQDVATSFNELRSRIKIGDAVTLTDSAGRLMMGRLVYVSGDRLEIFDGTFRQFAEVDVEAISRRWHESVGTGAAWGAVIGATIGLLTMSAELSSYRAPYAIEATALFAAPGAAAGAVLARLSIHQRLVFAKSDHQFSIVPLIERNRTGAVLTARW